MPNVKTIARAFMAAYLALAAPAMAGTSQHHLIPHSVRFDPSDGQWPALVPRLDAQRPLLAACLMALTRCRNFRELERWREIAIEAARRTGIDRLAYVNAAINSIVRWRSDRENYGVADYWATPLETLVRGGDCEDIAILKIETLHLAGVDDTAMSLLMVERFIGDGHMVALVRRGGASYVLDSLAVGLVPTDHYDARLVYAVGRGGAEIFGRSFRINDYLNH